MFSKDETNVAPNRERSCAPWVEQCLAQNPNSKEEGLPSLLIPQVCSDPSSMVFCRLRPLCAWLALRSQTQNFPGDLQAGRPEILWVRLCSSTPRGVNKLSLCVCTLRMTGHSWALTQQVPTKWGQHMRSRSQDTKTTAEKWLMTECRTEELQMHSCLSQLASG